ncbi:MAG TPA: hypothetical protein VNL74_05490 [Methylococcus sp.]|nr:hypothetical protein [Methylococcus sp.]
MTEKSSSPGLPSSGVELLIQRLREEGAARGRAEAEAIVTKARQKARELIEEAEQEAERIRAAARKDAEILKVSGEEALRLAFRDTILDLKDRISRRFGAEIRHLIGQPLSHPEFVQRLLLEVIGQVREEFNLQEVRPLRIEVPEEWIRFEDLRRNPEELREGSLTHFVLSVMAKVVDEGITIEGCGELSAGIRIGLRDGDVVIDFTEEALAALLLGHLHPRYRALLEGRVG